LFTCIKEAKLLNILLIVFHKWLENISAVIINHVIFTSLASLTNYTALSQMLKISFASSLVCMHKITCLKHDAKLLKILLTAYHEMLKITS